MSYEDHTDDECDKCREVPSNGILVPVDFYYLDKNDVAHKDVSEEAGYPKDSGYRRYEICLSCKERGV